MEHRQVSPPSEDRRLAVHAEHVAEVERLRSQIEALQEREPAVRKEISALQRELRALPADEREAPEKQLAELRTELQRTGPQLIEIRCRLGMKMSDFALDEGDDHEHAVEYLKPLLEELRNAYGRALWEADRNVADAEERMSALKAEHHDHGDQVAALVELRFQPLIDAEMIGVNIEQANVRIARHRLALVDPEDAKQHLARELELEDALGELDAARGRVTSLQEQKNAIEWRYSHPSAAKGKRLVKRFGRRLV